MKTILKTVIDYIFYRVSKSYDDAFSGGFYLGLTLFGFVMQPILYINNVPTSMSIEVGATIIPSLLGAAIGVKQKKRYERLCEKYKYENIENPFYELYGLLIWGFLIGSYLLGIYVMWMRYDSIRMVDKI